MNDKTLEARLRRDIAKTGTYRLSKCRRYADIFNGTPYSIVNIYTGFLHSWDMTPEDAQRWVDAE